MKKALATLEYILTKNTPVKGLVQFMAVLFIFSLSNISHAKDPRNVVIIQPFPYTKDASIPQNVKLELNLDKDIPEYMSTYFKKKRSFKDVSIANNINEKVADLYIEGEIIQVDTGNAGSRYVGGFTSAGKSRIVLNIKIYDENKKLLTRGNVTQRGSSGFGSISKTFSNRANITSAAKVIGKHVNKLIITGNTSEPEDIIKAIDSYKSDPLRAATKSAYSDALFHEENVTDAMASALKKMLDSSEKIKDKVLLDGLAWCAINLGASENNKYKPILEAVVASNAHRKVKKHAKKSLALLVKLES